MKLINQLNNLMHEKNYIGKKKDFADFLYDNEKELMTELNNVKHTDKVYVSKNCTYLKTLNLKFSHDEYNIEIWVVVKSTYKEINKLLQYQIEKIRKEQEKLNLNGADND